MNHASARNAILVKETWAAAVPAVGMVSHQVNANATAIGQTDIRPRAVARAVTNIIYVARVIIDTPGACGHIRHIAFTCSRVTQVLCAVGVGG